MDTNSTSEAPDGHLAHQLTQPGYWQFYADRSNSSSRSNSQVADGNKLIGFGLTGLVAMPLVWFLIGLLR
jgi:hypothetical protein